MDVTDLAMILSTIQTTPTEEDFRESVSQAGAIMMQLDDEQKLILYALFKQSTEGDCPNDLPTTSAVDKAKKQAWMSFHGVPAIDAQKAYIFLVNESASSQTAKHGMGGSVSTLFRQDDEDLTGYPVIIQLVLANNVDGLTTYIGDSGKSSDIDICDNNGLTALHHAADRGFLSVCQFLVSNGANTCVVDKDGQTALDYAEICEHKSVIDFLRTLSECP